MPCSVANTEFFLKLIVYDQRNCRDRIDVGALENVGNVLSSDVDKADSGTSRMEWFNLTTWMTLRRYTRLTNGHSKKTRNHDAMLGLYVAWYNWCRKHATLKTTPAVKAGLASEVWTLEKVLTVAAA